MFINGNNFDISSNKNILFLFTPRAFQKQAIRPLAYSLNDKFVNEINDSILENIENVETFSMIRNLANSPNAQGAFIPVHNNPMEVNMNDFSNNWSFLLIVNNETANFTTHANGFGGANSPLTNRMRENRVVYSGFFLNDEPINRTTMNTGNPTLNPDATIMITHKTHTNKLTHMHNNGMTGKRSGVISDSDVVHPNIINKITNTGVHQLTPDILMENTEAHTDAESNYVTSSMYGENTEINNSQNTINIDSNLSSPKDNIRKILKGVVLATSAVLSIDHMGNYGQAGDLSSMLDSGHDDLFTGTMRNSFKPHPDLIGMSANDVVSIVELVARYDPTIQPVVIENTLNDSVNQFDNTPRNIWSSMIVTTVPAIMSNCLLNQVSMQYDSYGVDGRSPAVYFNDVGTIVDMTESEKQTKVNAFLYCISTDVFEMLYQARGHFSLQFSINIGGISKCILNFYSDDNKVAEPYEVPTIAGGLLSNMLGDVNVASHNGESLSGLANELSGVNNESLREFEDHNNTLHINPLHDFV